MKKLLLTTIIGSTIMLSGCGDTGGGEKIGMITKIAQEGVFCKTWEAEIVRGGFNAGTGVSGQSFHFTIESPELLKKLQYALDHQSEIKIKYRTELATLCRTESNNAFLTDIEIIDNSKTNKENSYTSHTENTNNMNGNTTNVNPKVLELLKTQAALIEALVKEQK